MNMLSRIGRIRSPHRQRGVSMIEYALIAALIAVVAIVALTQLGGNVEDKFSEVGTAVDTAGD